MHHSRKSRRDSDDEKYESSRKRSRTSELSKKNINCKIELVSWRNAF